jgi:hypothetical protein
MSDDIKTVQMTHGEAMEALWRREQVIKRLQHENEKLRAALKPFADIAPKYDPPEGDDDQPLYDTRNFPTIGQIRAAAAAIRGKVKAEAACPEPDEAP